MDPQILITQYTVSCIPEESVHRPSFEITVERRAPDRWAVLRNSRCLNRDGSWDYEPRSSNREDDWLDEHRFTAQDALRLAAEWASKITSNHMTVADALDNHRRCLARLRS